MSPVPMMPLAAALLLLLVPGSLGKHPATATATNNPTKQGTFATSASSCTSTEYFVTPTSTCSNCDPSTGVCQDSSCVVFGFPNSAKANCANGGCDPAYCSYFAGCSITETTGVQHCFGITRCSDGSTTCAGAGNGYGYGNLCLQDGTSGNFKICGGVSVLAADSPNPSASFCFSAIFNANSSPAPTGAQTSGKRGHRSFGRRLSIIIKCATKFHRGHPLLSFTCRLCYLGTVWGRLEPPKPSPCPQ